MLGARLASEGPVRPVRKRDSLAELARQSGKTYRDGLAWVDEEGEIVLPRFDAVVKQACILLVQSTWQSRSDHMARTQKRGSATESDRPTGQRPVSKAVFVRETLESCRSGRCCRDQTMLDAAYEQYVNNPDAPWNRQRRRR
jgi:hypothetical protein